MISMKQEVVTPSVNDEDIVVPMEDDAQNDPMDLSKGEFKLAFISMGQGECTLIRCPDGSVGMIDCGSKAYFSSSVAAKDKDRILAEIGQGIRDLIDVWSGAKLLSASPDKYNKNVLDFLILTHCDGDHYNKIKVFIETGITISKVYFSDGPNAIGPESFFGGDNGQLFRIKDKGTPPSSLAKYSSSKNVGNAILKGAWNTTEAIEVVINNNERSTYSYNLDPTSKVQSPSTENGGCNSKYGTKQDLGDDGVCEVLSSSTDGWEISIIAGNVLVADSSLASVDIEDGNDDDDDDDDDTAVGQKRQPSAQQNRPNPKKQKTYLANVWAPYSNPESKNTASLCTRITFNNENGEQEMILLMGDATNTTFEFLNSITKTEDNCVLSNVPHHGSAVHCNDMNSAEQLPEAGSLNYIQSNLRPKASIVSCRPFYTSFKFPALNVVNNYSDIVELLDDGHLFDEWVAVPPNNGVNIVKTKWDSLNSDLYTTIKKSKVDWHYLKEENPPANSFLILCPKKGVMLQRIGTNANVKLPDLNYDKGQDGFKYIYHEYQVF